MAKEKEIVIPVSKVKTRKKSEAPQEETLEEMVQKVENNPWDVSKIDTGIKSSGDGKILVSFTKFVQLIATHDFADLMSRYGQEDITISSDLLVELAATPVEEVQESRFSWVFLGVVLGAITAAVIFMFFVN